MPILHIELSGKRPKARCPRLGLVLGMAVLTVTSFHTPAFATVRQSPALAPAAPAKAVPTALAENGTAMLPIVISGKAGAQTQAVAAELADYLKRISGADFQIKAGDGNSGIVLGTLKDFPVADLTQPLEIRNTYDGVEAFAIRTEGKRVLLLGNTDLGASHAAFRFLETLGCRWFFPAREWEIVPRKTTLRVALNETCRPAVLSRRIWWSYGTLEDSDNPNKPKEQWRAWREWEGWKRHNRQAASFAVDAAHAYGGIVEANKKEFDVHPEYFGLVGGKRTSWQMCLSNAAVRRMAVNYALDYFQKNPHADMISMEPNDGGNMCECPDCVKLGTISDRVFGVANEVARAVAKKYPGKMVGMLAYYQHSDPPTMVLEPNVHVQIATLYTQGKYTFKQQLALWPQHSRNLGIYDYPSNWEWGQDRLRPPSGTGAGASMQYWKKNIPYFVTQGVRSYDAESSNSWGQYGIGYYVANKLMWSPTDNVDTLLADFYDKAFGPAAPAMKRFYERISPDSKPLFGRDLLARAYRDLQDASVLAANNPDVLARLDDLKQYMRYNQFYWQLDEAGNDKAKQKELTLQLLEQSYRTRFSYMTHSSAMVVEGSRGAASQFDEPTWNYWDLSPVKKPWKLETFYTHEETEKEFQQGLEYFQPQEVDEKKFSDDLVPVVFPETKVSALSPFFPKLATTQYFAGSVRYALFSFKGEPLELEITKEPENRTSFALFNASGNVLAAQAYRPVSEYAIGVDTAQKYRFEVPGPGLYYLEISSTNRGVGFGAKQPATVVLPRDVNLDSYIWGGTPHYFYVPKGTRQIQYYWSGMAHRIINPNNEVARDVNANYEYITIPVPEGMDGRPWGVAARLGQMWLFNCPNFVAATPDALMVPRELAVKDGLTIRR